MSPLDYESMAKKAAGNWKRFDSFAWDGPDDADQYTLVYTSNRDSGILDESNAHAIGKALAPYVRREWVREEDHSHWACGWVKGYAIRVYRPDGKVSRAFKVWCDLKARMDEYPFLDEDDHSERESDATFEAWESASIRDRLEVCKRQGVSILAARHSFGSGRMDECERDRLEQYVRDCWITF